MITVFFSKDYNSNVLILALLQALACGWGLCGLQMCQLREGENYFFKCAEGRKE